VRAAGSYWLLSQQPPRGDLRVWYLANRVDSITLQLKWRLFAAGRDYVGISCVSAILGASVLDCAMAEAPYSHVCCHASACPVSSRRLAGCSLRSVHDVHDYIYWASDSGHAASARSGLLGVANARPRLHVIAIGISQRCSGGCSAIAPEYNYARCTSLRRHFCDALVSECPCRAEVDFLWVRSED